MKIVTYNISHSSQEKIDKILENDADVFVLPELACPSMVRLRGSYHMEWTGDIDFKGLGVIWKSDLNVEVPDWFNPKHQYFLPLIVEGKLIMAAWPTTTTQNKPKKYPQIAMEAFEDYSQHLKEYPSIITGDMNCYKGQSGENRKYGIQAIFDFLGDLGFFSAYHKQTGELLGQETTHTYFHRFMENSPFFIDYTFSNVPLKTYKIGEWDREVSDHVPQIIEL